MPLYRITSPEGQTYEIDGPDGATQEEIVAQIKSQIASAQPKEQSQLRQVADVPLKIGAGVVGGVRMVTDAFGANNPVSQNLKGMEGYISDLFSAQSKKDSAEISRIMKDAEDKGVGDQLKAAVNAFSTAPIDFLANALGTAAPAIAAGMAGAVLRLGAAGVGAMQAGTGATMGAGIIKGSIYDAVKEELKKTDMSPEQVEARAQKAQEYGGENLDSILAGAALTGLASTVGIDPIIARGLSKKIIGEAAGKGLMGIGLGLGLHGLNAATSHVANMGLHSDFLKALTHAVQSNPVLKNADEAKVLQYGETIFKFAPHIAGDANLLSSILANAVHGEGIDPMTQQDKLRVNRIRRKCLLILDSMVSEMYSELFEQEEED